MNSSKTYSEVILNKDDSYIIDNISIRGLSLPTRGYVRKDHN